VLLRLVNLSLVLLRLVNLRLRKLWLFRGPSLSGY